jgi:hypothetical protein
MHWTLRSSALLWDAPPGDDTVFNLRRRFRLGGTPLSVSVWHSRIGQASVPHTWGMCGDGALPRLGLDGLLL